MSEGRADVSVFVEYPGRAQGRFQNGLRAIFNSDLTLMELGQAQYQSRFADHPGQYSLLQPTIESELTMNPYTWYSAWEDQTISLPSMLCTHLVIAGRTPESIENTALRENYIRPMQQDVLSQVNPDRLQPSTSTRFLNLSK